MNFSVIGGDDSVFPWAVEGSQKGSEASLEPPWSSRGAFFPRWRLSAAP